MSVVIYGLNRQQIKRAFSLSSKVGREDFNQPKNQGNTGYFVVLACLLLLILYIFPQLRHGKRCNYQTQVQMGDTSTQLEEIF